MRRTSIVIASILKPVSDTRMYEKIGLSLSQTNKYDVNIIGFSEKNIQVPENVFFHPLYNFKRLSYKRIFAGFKFYRKLLIVKPEIIIINTYELLLFTIFFKFKNQCKIIYDIIENHSLNILDNKSWPWGIRHLLAYRVRLIERITRSYIDKFIVAEKSYKDELKFLREDTIYLPNKFANPVDLQLPKKQNDRNSLNILYTGTISENYGILSSLAFIEKLHKQNPDVTFTIVGYCANRRLYQHLMNIIGEKSYITMIGGNRLVPHHEILKYIKQADFGIVNYQLTKSISRCFPTKIYEYMGCQLPILVQDYPDWSSFILKYHGGIVVDFNDPDYESLFRQIKADSFYNIEIPEHEIYWNGNELVQYLEQ